MFIKKPILKYQSLLKEYPNSIVPSKTKVPDWYKKISAWKDGEMMTTNIDGHNVINATLKHCVPFLESLTIGYMINLPYDLYVKNQNGSPYIVWKVEDEYAPKWRPSNAHESLVPVGFAPIEYTWNMCVTFEVPKGYSMLITHPLNRPELPFFTLTGVIDGNFTTYPYGQYPFYIKKDFEGMIEQGTPIAQIIPFRQENWSSKNTKGLIEKSELVNKKARLVFFNWYKKNFWSKKIFE